MMEYKRDIIANLNQLENYARTCFVLIMKLSNGQGERLNTYLDMFMSDLTGGELTNRYGRQILLDECLYTLLPGCRDANRAEATYLFILCADWIIEHLHKCDQCGEWYIMERGNQGMCDNCTKPDADTVADFMNDLDKCHD